MAGVLRRLVTEVVLRSTVAVKGLRAYDALWKATAKSVESSAAVIERAADRAGAAMARMATGAATVRAGAGAARMGAGGGRGGSSGRRGPDPLDAAIGRANRAEAMQSGMRQGAVAVSSATAALGKFATASDRARAKVADLDAQVQRNRKDLADLRAEALRTGDADGTLAAKMRGLSVATGQANVALQQARRELRAVDGSLIDAVKNAANLSGRFDAMRVAAGNLIAAGITRGVQAIGGRLIGAAKGAIDFESSMADVKKVLSDADLKNFEGLNKGVLELSKNIGIAPTEVAALTAALAQSGIAGDELIKTAEDASKLAVAFGMSGQDAGQALAKLRTGLGLTRDEVNSLTGTINELSNNMAATAPEITSAVQRVGSVARAANISAQSTAALATSMIASGANAEVAATGTKNFIRALGAGAAATRKQREAFTALGLTAEGTAAELVKGGKQAEAAIADVVTRIGKLRAEDRLPVLIELFGSESIGAIGPLATNIDLLTKSFELAGDAAAAAGSVEKEFAARSSTTDQAIKKLKASVSVLAIEFGNQLLPYINDIVKFLTSPEGQEWGASAVAKAKDVVVGFAEAVRTVGGFLSGLIDMFGGTATAVGALGVAIAGLAGPWGIAAAAATAAFAVMVSGIANLLTKIPLVTDAIDSISVAADRAREKERIEKIRAEEDAAMRGPVAGDGRSYGYGAAPMASGPAPDSEAGVLGLAEARAKTGKVDLSGMTDEQKRSTFNALVARRKTLRPSERKMLQALSKDLDLRIPGSSGKEHKQTKMDKRLAALDPSLRGVLTAGGEKDAGGDLKVHDDVLSRAVYGRATGTSGGGGGSLGPGPNIITHNYFNTVTVQQAIDARSTAPVPENIRSAGEQAGKRAGEVLITGFQKVIANRNAGGRMVG